MLHKTFLFSLVCATALMLSSCGGSGSKKQNVESVESVETVESTTAEQSDDDILAMLLKNSEKVVRLKSVVNHGGQVYAGGYPEIPGGYWAVPGWKPVEPNPDAEEMAIVGNTIIYNVNTRYAPELWRMDLKTGAKTLIANNIGYTRWSVCIAGDRIIYTTRDDDFGQADIFWYDLKTSQITKLLDKDAGKEFHSVVSFDSDFVYYTPSYNSDDVWRVRWNGTQAEAMKDVKMPENLYKVEGDYYYCFDYNTGQISRYKMNDGMLISIEPIYGILWDIVDGWAYYVNEQMGLYKVNLTNSATVQLAATLKENWDFDYIIGIVGDDMYVKASKTVADNPCGTARIYKVSLQGGIEYQNKEWIECGD